MSFATEFALPVLQKINAPDTQTNLAMLTGWSAQEKGGPNWSQWCNPLNSTEPYVGAIDSGAQPGAHDVKIYLSVPDGVAATVITLLWEPDGSGSTYAGIVRELRASTPARYWAADAQAQLQTWGTGAGFLASVPLMGDSPMEEQIAALFAEYLRRSGTGPDPGASGLPQGQTVLDWFTGMYLILLELKARPGGTVTVDNTAVLAAIADLKAHPAVLSDPVLLGKVSLIENNLNAPRPAA